MELAIAAAVIAFAFGMAFGILIASRHVELECEEAYITGHVDGYERCELDMSLHRDGDRTMGEWDA